MIKMHGYIPAWGVPDVSPFVTKIDCYLRMVGLPYTLVKLERGDLTKTPKGKLPVIEDDGNTVCDSVFIVEYLKKKHGDTLDADMSRSTWQGIFTSDLSRWAGVSNSKITFSSHSDSGLPSNFSGKVQNDSHAGDIRFCAHRIDGPGKALAYTYYPPPTNSSTAAGDLHLDYAEHWTSAAAAVTKAGGSIFASNPVGLAQAIL